MKYLYKKEKEYYILLDLCFRIFYRLFVIAYLKMITWKASKNFSNYQPMLKKTIILTEVAELNNAQSFFALTLAFHNELITMLLFYFP